jgi:hypothetical protein
LKPARYNRNDNQNPFALVRSESDGGLTARRQCTAKAGIWAARAIDKQLNSLLEERREKGPCRSIPIIHGRLILAGKQTAPDPTWSAYVRLQPLVPLQ